MAHKVWYLTSDSTINTAILNKYASEIESAWKDVFSEGTFEKNDHLGRLNIPNKISIELGSKLYGQASIANYNNYLCCALFNGSTRIFTDIYGGVYGTSACKSDAGVSGWEFNDPLYLHMITSKQKKTVMLGLSDSADRIGAQVLVSKIDTDNYVGIQLGINPYGGLYNVADDNSYVSPANCGNDRYDGYVKDDLLTTARTQSLYGPGWYITDGILAISPAVDPWRNKVIPDTYISVCGPYNKAGLDGIISIGNRKFMTGHTFSHNGSGKVPWDDPYDRQITDGGIVTFVEVE